MFSEHLLKKKYFTFGNKISQQRLLAGIIFAPTKGGIIKKIVKMLSVCRNILYNQSSYDNLLMGERKK